MDWTIIMPTGLLFLGIAGFFLTSSSRHLTIREQAAFNAFITRELDQLHAAVRVLEQTRPTTGELQAELTKKRAR